MAKFGDMITNHPLADWIDARMSRAAFARKAGISEPHLSLILQGKRGLSLDVAIAIERATENEVTAAIMQQQQPAGAAQ